MLRIKFCETAFSLVSEDGFTRRSTSWPRIRSEKGRSAKLYRRERARERRASETAEQREVRLRIRRERVRARRASQSEEAREALRERDRVRRASQSVGEREERVHQTETAEEREARLLQVRSNRHDRLCAETATEREVRLQRDRDSHVYSKRSGG